MEREKFVKRGMEWAWVILQKDELLFLLKESVGIEIGEGVAI